jgi:hypothetical protein
MAGSLSDYAENKLLDHLMGKTSFTMPSTVYAALCTVAITDNLTGSTITEANYTGYARKQIAAADLNASSGGVMTNANAITFAACTAGSSTIIGIAICDASTAGNMLCYSDVTSHVIDTSNTPATIDAAALSLTLT